MQQCYIQIKNIIQKQFKYQKGVQIEYFINMVVVCNMCTHTRTLRMICLGKKRLCLMRNEKLKKKFLQVFIIVGNYVHITYKAIAISVQGSSWGGVGWGWGVHLRKNSTVAQQSSQYEKADIMWTFAMNFLFCKIWGRSL